MGEITEIDSVEPVPTNEPTSEPTNEPQPIYTFKQTLQDVTVYCPLTPGTRAKMLKVEIASTKIHVQTLAGQTLIDGQLFAPIKLEDSTWSVEDQKELIVTLEKTKQEWWPHVVTTDPKIDIRKIQPENSRLEELDSETRASVEKMMFDENQKRQGLPSSDELQQQKMLDRFKAQHPELDFSQLSPDKIKFSGKK